MPDENTPEVTLEELQSQLAAATESIGRLETKNQELLGEKKTASKAATEAEAARQAAAEDAARKGGDVEALDKSWNDKYSALSTDTDTRVKELNGVINSLTTGAKAAQMAAELSVQGSAEVLLPHIQGRLKTDYRDGQPVTVVLDAQGNASAMTVDELKVEISNTAAFAPLIVGSKASGAGGIGGKGNGGAVPSGNMGGNKTDRVAALAAKYPELNR